MNRSLHIASAVWLMALLLGGCVTKSTFEEMQTEKNQEIASLQAERQALQHQRADLQQQIQDLDAQRAGLQEQKAELERESVGLQTKVGLLANDKDALEQANKALAQQKTALMQQQADLQKQVDALGQQKEQLLAASQETQSQYDALVKDLTQEVKKGELQVRRYKNMLTVDVAEQLFFASGSAHLKDTGKDVLKKVGAALKDYPDKIVRVVGHTDNVPIAKSLQDKYASNWELSVARATTVVRFLQQIGVPPERLIASGRAEYAPVASNDTPEGREKNRRIEITLIDKSLAQETNQASN